MRYTRKSGGVKLHKIIALFQRQFRAHSISLIFLTLSFTISILLISIGTSAVIELKQADLIKGNTTPELLTGSI